MRRHGRLLQMLGFVLIVTGTIVTYGTLGASDEADQVEAEARWDAQPTVPAHPSNCELYRGIGIGLLIAGMGGALLLMGAESGSLRVILGHHPTPDQVGSLGCMTEQPWTPPHVYGATNRPAQHQKQR